MAKNDKDNKPRKSALGEVRFLGVSQEGQKPRTKPHCPETGPESPAAKARRAEVRKYSGDFPFSVTIAQPPPYTKPTGVPMTELDFTPASPRSEWILPDKD